MKIENENYITTEDNKLENNYSCLVLNDGSIFGYVNSFLSVPNGGKRIYVNNEPIFLKKAYNTQLSKIGRYRKILVVPLKDNSDKKKVYKNKNGEYYYSYKEENDEYICLFEELIWKYKKTQELMEEDYGEKVLTKDLKVWVYSDYFLDFFYNTISSVQNDSVMVLEFDSPIPKRNVYLTKYEADLKCKNEILNMEKDFNWLHTLQQSLDNGINLTSMKKSIISYQLWKLINDISSGKLKYIE